MKATTALRIIDIQKLNLSFPRYDDENVIHRISLVEYFCKHNRKIVFIQHNDAL